jgi:hypothetical protein
MKILIKKSVISSNGWRNEGEIHDLDDKLAKHYLAKGIGVEYKEEKAKKETKEAKTPRKRTTKKTK